MCGDFSCEVRGTKEIAGGSAGLLLLLAGCYGGVEVPAGAADGATDTDLAPGGDASDEGGNETGGDETEGEDETGDPPTGCEATDGLPAVPLRFLTRLEYENTIRDIFGRSLDVTSAFPPDEAVGGFFSNSVRAPSTTQIEQFVEAAGVLAGIAVWDDASSFVACQPSDSSCAETFIVNFGRLAFRRPLQSEEVDTYLADYDAIRADQGGEVALEVVLTSLLSSPHFLYIGARTESSDPAAPAYDLASRLSYFLWATMPDDALFAAAENGELDSVEGVESHARRMLDDPRSAAALQSFGRQWLEVEGLFTNAPKDADLFGEWTPELASAAERESAKLVEDVITNGDAKLASILTDRRAWIDADLADLYGVPTPAGGQGWVELPEGERAGILTRAAFLAGHAHSQETSWVHRGKLVRERFLCGELPPPPPVADDSPLNDGGRLEDPACAGCHVLMDPIGLGFEQYDAVGVFVDGNAPGVVHGLDEPDFDGALELSDRLAQTPQVAECFAEQLFAFANRRAVEEGDECDVARIREAFVEGDGDIRELLVTFAVSDAFTGMGGQ